MITVKCYNNQKSEYFKYDDIIENEVNYKKSNIRPIEYKLLNTNRGKHRRVKNNHAERLAKFKASN